MAISLKVDDESLPAVTRMLGINLGTDDMGSSAAPPSAGGDPSAAATATGQPPPIDPSMGGADNPTGQPSPAQSDRIPSLSSDAPPDSKLTALQKIISGQNPSSGSKYQTQLDPAQEQQFQSWVKQNKVPWQDSPTADYDMRGYWKAQQSGDANAQQAQNGHFPDTYKTPYHKTFSNESVYATPDAPHWEGSRLVDKSGKVIADETPSTQSSLQKIIGASKATATMPQPPPDLTVGQNQPPPDTSGIAASGGQNSAATTPEEASFLQRHPTLAKILNSGLEFAQDAGPGVGSHTFGEGFQTAASQPFIRQQRAQELDKNQAQIDLMKNTVTVRDPYGNSYQIPKGQLPKFLQTNIPETGKNTRNQSGLDSKESIADQKNVTSLRKQGLRINAQGQQENIPYGELTEAEQSKIDLQHANEDAAGARADMERAKNDPNSAAYKAAMGRLRVAQQNANTAVGRLGIEKNKFNADYLGLGPDQQPLPGVTTDVNGKPIGPRVANAGKIPADRLKRGDLAHNAITNLDDIAGMIHDNPDLFGSLAGRITTIREMMGSDNPVIREIGIAGHNYALASAGVHGTRSQGAVEKTENELLNHWKDGSDAVLGGIGQAKKSLQQFVDNQSLGNRAIPADGSTPPKATPPASNNSTQSRDKKLGVVYLP